MELLQVKNISKSFENKKILKDISLTMEKDELVCILGKSGIGKSTLFHIISGLMEPDEGEIILNGQKITNQPGHISYMLQKDLLLPYRSVEDNVILPLLVAGWKKRAAREKAGEYFEEFGLKGCQKKWPSQLSGGMRQRAALLRTYLFSKEAALLDEPFSALDAMTKASMQRWYMKVMEKIHLSTLFITHDIDEAILLSDRILLLEGEPAEISDEIIISQPRSNRKEFPLTQEYLDYKKKILHKLA